MREDERGGLDDPIRVNDALSKRASCVAVPATAKRKAPAGW
jgi:hypothetical protein